MADERRFDLEDLLLRPGCYFNPQTEIMVVVDDSPTLDAEIFNLEPFEGADWVLIADEVPVDEARRDELLETFQATYQGGNGIDKTLTDGNKFRVSPRVGFAYDLTGQESFVTRGASPAFHVSGRKFDACR